MGDITAGLDATQEAQKVGLQVHLAVRRRHTVDTRRATGITAYLKNGGQLETAAAMANHASTRTTQLYDRRADQVSLDEVELVRI